MKFGTMLFVWACTACAAHGARTVETLSGGWEFSRDGASWCAVSVPHDWAISGPFDPAGDCDTAKLPWKGKGSYRRRLVVPSVSPERRWFLDFDGVSGRSAVFVNGHPCGGGTYGYLGFRVDATPYLVPGTNELVVTADTTGLRSRWYPGAGIYRRVRLVGTDALLLDERDLAIVTPEVSAARATVRATGFVTSRRLADAEDVAVSVELFAPDGRRVAARSARVSVPAFGKAPFSAELAVEKPELWDLVPSPALYSVRVSVAAPGAEDAVRVRIGFRFFSFPANDGFHLNGRRVQLNGVDLHSDLGILGMAFNRSAMRRQLAVMRDMGANALRTAHNPPSPEVLDLCDEMGFFVWNECFDKWNGTCGRGELPLEEFVEGHLRDFVRRDRNHPCVFVWSIGNEIAPARRSGPGADEKLRGRALGTTAERCTRFRAAVREEDATRPVGIGSCSPDVVSRGDYDNLDVTGWNYGAKYRPMRARAPDKPVLYTESASAFSDYGCYPARLPTNKTDYAVAERSVDSWDYTAADWSDVPDHEFERMERDRYVGGEFVWTGIDYLGEPCPYDGWCIKDLPPEARARSSYFGVCDLLAFPKDRFYLYRAHWNKSAFTLHLVPDHWTFPEREGATVPVFVYTSAPEAEVFVNGVSQGRRRRDPSATGRGNPDYHGVLPRYRLAWPDVKWRAGEIRAVAYGSGGEKLGEEVLRTAGAPVAVTAEPEAELLPADRDEFVFVKLGLKDAAGTRVPRESRRLFFAVEGPGEIVAAGNSDPHGTDPFTATDSHPLRHGRAGLALRRTGPGAVTLVASAPGLEPARVRFPAVR